MTQMGWKFLWDEPGTCPDLCWRLWELEKVEIWPLWVQNLTKKVKISDEIAKNESISSLKKVQNDLKLVKSALEMVEISSRVPNTAIELQFDSPSRHRFTFKGLLNIPFEKYFFLLCPDSWNHRRSKGQQQSYSYSGAIYKRAWLKQNCLPQ